MNETQKSSKHAKRKLDSHSLDMDTPDNEESHVMKQAAQIRERAHKRTQKARKENVVEKNLHSMLPNAATLAHVVSSNGSNSHRVDGRENVDEFAHLVSNWTGQIDDRLPHQKIPPSPSINKAKGYDRDFRLLQLANDHASELFEGRQQMKVFHQLVETKLGCSKSTAYKRFRRLLNMHNSGTMVGTLRSIGYTDRQIQELVRLSESLAETRSVIRSVHRTSRSTPSNINNTNTIVHPTRASLENDKQENRIHPHDLSSNVDTMVDLSSLGEDTVASTTFDMRHTHGNKEDTSHRFAEEDEDMNEKNEKQKKNHVSENEMDIHLSGDSALGKRIRNEGDVILVRKQLKTVLSAEPSENYIQALLEMQKREVLRQSEIAKHELLLQQRQMEHEERLLTLHDRLLEQRKQRDHEREIEKIRLSAQMGPS